MNEEFRNSYENDGVPVSPTENTEPKPSANDMPFFSAEVNDVPAVEAEVVEEPKAAPQPPENPSYQQNYSAQFSNGYYSQPNNTQQPYYYNQQNYNPPQPQKSGKGKKIFFAIIAVVIVFALGFGAASISKSADKNPQTSTSDRPVNKDLPEVNINESPVSPTKLSSGGGVLTGAQIHAKLAKSNVGIVVYARNTNSSAGEGSGIIMGEDKTGTYTYIITCAHVINDAGVNVSVQTEDGTTYEAEIAGFDTRTDIGVLRIKANGLPAAEFGDSNSLVVGDPVYAIGNPGGIEFFGTQTTGFISAIDRPVSSEIGYTMKCIQHDAAINPGNSGGMLVNAYGQVIGINSQKIAATEYEGMGFAIPISSAKEIIENLIQFGYVPDRPKLGITYYPVSASAQYSMIAQIKGLPAGTLIINEIDPDSSLANTNVRQYDMITAVNGKPLTTADVLLELIDGGKVGDKFTLSICRVNSNYTFEEFDVDITLIEDKSSSEPMTTTQPQYIDPFEYFYDQFGF
ncbi:MAG: trypsin-like peptidase domain-containing protein [Clostridia bacterium]|nr:trypsin-like peptidase domain-containing protein [Clostridia bacterium]